MLLFVPVRIGVRMVLVFKDLHVLLVFFAHKRVVYAGGLVVVDFDEGAVVIGLHVVCHVVVVGVVVLRASPVLAVLRIVQVHAWEVASFFRLVRLDWVQAVRFEERLLRYVNGALRVKRDIFGWAHFSRASRLIGLWPFL